jgi:nitroimidazol reductase NimA-like FMN-containing flavoprotein (pyridoxamine 5'-phosphate oxidase superfamily)
MIFVDFIMLIVLQRQRKNAIYFNQVIRTMVNILSANDPLAGPMNEKELKDFLDKKDLLIHIGTVDEKGEPFVTPTIYYFDRDSDKIYLSTQKNSKKVKNLRRKNTIYFCIDDPTPPYKGVRGRATVKINEDINHNITIIKKILMRAVGSLEDPTAKWILNDTENGNEAVVEISPSYYTTWDYSKTP